MALTPAGGVPISPTFESNDYFLAEVDGNTRRVASVASGKGYASFAQFIADTRTFTAGTTLTIPSIGAVYTATAGAGNLGQPNAGGQAFDVAFLNGAASVAAFGPGGDGNADDLAAVQSAMNSGAELVSITSGTFNLNAGTLTAPANLRIILSGGVLTNGTLVCDDAYISGTRGFSETIVLQGTVANEDGVFFDWFTCEKATKASYDTFINGANPTYGAVPAISTVNRLIFTMLTGQRHTVRFGGGIYPFDAEIPISGPFYISSPSRENTLLWAPQSNFMHYSSGGSAYPYFKDITIEADGSVLLTDANTVNAIHGLKCINSQLSSYSNHALYNDDTIAGGTGCPIYGAKFLDSAIYAGPGFGGVTGWQSGSNIFDNFVDKHQFFNGQSTNKKGIIKAMFYNSSVRKYCNSNVAYAGFEHFFLADKPNSLYSFFASDNVFETNPLSYETIVKMDATGSQLFMGTRNNQYTGSPTGLGYHYVSLNGTVRVQNTDSPTPIYGNFIDNEGDQYVRNVTKPLDVAGTKYRLRFLEPHSREGALVSSGPVLTPTAELAALVGMSSIYAADSANISFIEVKPSFRMANSKRLAGGYGTTASRPTSGLYIGYPYFDTTLGYAITYNGTGWVDGAGVAV